MRTGAIVVVRAAARVWQARRVTDPDLTDALVAELARKTGVCWVRHAGHTHAVWHVWSDDALCVVSGGDEQPLPDVEDGARVEVRDAQQGQRRPAAHLGRHRVRRTPGVGAVGAGHGGARAGTAERPGPGHGRRRVGRHQRRAPDPCRPASSSSRRAQLSDDGPPARRRVATPATHPRPAAAGAAPTRRVRNVRSRRSAGQAGTAISPDGDRLDLAGDVAAASPRRRRPRRGRTARRAGPSRRPGVIVVAAALGQQPGRDQRHPEPGGGRPGRRVLGHADARARTPARARESAGRVARDGVQVHRVQQVLDGPRRGEPLGQRRERAARTRTARTTASSLTGTCTKRQPAAGDPRLAGQVGRRQPEQPQQVADQRRAAPGRPGHAGWRCSSTSVARRSAPRSGRRRRPASPSSAVSRPRRPQHPRRAERRVPGERDLLLGGEDPGGVLAARRRPPTTGTSTRRSRTPAASAWHCSVDRSSAPCTTASWLPANGRSVNTSTMS